VTLSLVWKISGLDPSFMNFIVAKSSSCRVLCSCFETARSTTLSFFQENMPEGEKTQPPQ
jgi:hypothetical protein